MGIQKIKREIRLHEWAEQVRQCRESGMTVDAWCEANGVKKTTYYGRQRAVANVCCNELAVMESRSLAAAPPNVAPSFAEYEPPRSSTGTALTLHLAYGTLEIHNGADEVVIERTLRAMKSLC